MHRKEFLDICEREFMHSMALYLKQKTYDNMIPVLSGLEIVIFAEADGKA